MSNNSVTNAAELINNSRSIIIKASVTSEDDPQYHASYVLNNSEVQYKANVINNTLILEGNFNRVNDKYAFDSFRDFITDSCYRVADFCSLIKFLITLDNGQTVAWNVDRFSPLSFFSSFRAEGSNVAIDEAAPESASVDSNTILERTINLEKYEAKIKKLSITTLVFAGIMALSVVIATVLTFVIDRALHLHSPIELSPAHFICLGICIVIAVIAFIMGLIFMFITKINIRYFKFNKKYEVFQQDSIIVSSRKILKIGQSIMAIALIVLIIVLLFDYSCKELFIFLKDPFLILSFSL